MLRDDGYTCERCGYTVSGVNAKYLFRDHVLQHDYRDKHSLLRTPFNAADRAVLKVNRIRNDFEDEDA